jgi:preprotein translocase subunit SecF
VTRLFAGTSYDFTGQRRKSYAASAALLLLSVAGALINLLTIGELHPHGVEFTGGVLVELRVDPPASEERLRGALDGLGPLEIATLGDGQSALLRARLSDGEEPQAFRARLEERLGSSPGAGTAQVVSVEPLGAEAGAEALGTTALGVLLALLLGALYLGVRFGVRPGAAAALATVHDGVILFGSIGLLRVVVDPTVVAAALAGFAYSLRDKAVVLERVREHASRKGARRPDSGPLVNRALNETLPRSALTGTLTVLPALALVIVGPATVRGFALVLTVGILLATYSSLFLLGPLLLELDRPGASDRKRKTRPHTAAV